MRRKLFGRCPGEKGIAGKSMMYPKKKACTRCRSRAPGKEEENRERGDLFFERMRKADAGKRANRKGNQKRVALTPEKEGGGALKGGGGSWK